MEIDSAPPETPAVALAPAKLGSEQELPLPALSVLEDRLDRQAEEARDLEGERQAGVVLAGLDGVDALARDVEPFSRLK